MLDSQRMIFNSQPVLRKGEALYLYCFVRSALLSSIKEAGIDSRNTLFTWSFGNIAAVLGVVSVDDFCGPPAESRMQDPSWMVPHACRHEEVIEKAMLYSPVFPARFGTLFSSVESLSQLLARHHDTVCRFLDEVSDKQEWSVKGMFRRSLAEKSLCDTMLARQEARMALLSSGIRYLYEQRIRRGVEKDLNTRLKDLCRTIADRLQPFASDWCRRRIVSPAESDDGTETVFNWAFLVPRHDVESFCEGIESINGEIAANGLSIELSGPWPPYSFCLSLGMEPGA